MPVEGFVGIHVLAAVVAIGIPIAGDVFHGENAHPFLEVHLAERLRSIGLRRGPIHGVDQIEQVREIVRGILHRAGPPVPAVTRRFLHAAGGGEVL